MPRRNEKQRWYQFFFFCGGGGGGGQIRCVMGDVQVANTRARELGLVGDAHVRYRISSNNSRPSINRLPRIVASLWWKYLKLSPPSNNHPSPAPFAIFSSFYPFCVKLKRNEIHQNWPWRFKLWKLIKELNLEHLKSPCSLLFFLFNGKINKKYSRRSEQYLKWSLFLESSPFCAKKINNRPRLLFEEIR